MTHRVFVVQDDGTKNLLPAFRYGSPVIMSSGADDSFYSTVELVEKFSKHLADFTSSDFLLLVGSPTSIAVAAALAAASSGGQFQLLRWDRQERTYYVVPVNIREQVLATPYREE